MSSPQSWNRYAYVLNNPLISIDPLGLDCVYDNGDGTATVITDECSPTDSGFYFDGTVDSNSIGVDSNGNLWASVDGSAQQCSGDCLIDSVTVDGGSSSDVNFPNLNTSGANSANSWKHTGMCLLKGAAVGAGGAIVVGRLAVGAMALGAPAAAVTGVLLVAGGIGGASTLYSAGTNVAHGNYAGAAYDVGSLAGGAAAGGLIGGVVGDSINPPATRGWSVSRDLANGYNRALGSIGSWLGTGPDAAAAGGGTGAAGSGLARFLRGGC